MKWCTCLLIAAGVVGPCEVTPPNGNDNANDAFTMRVTPGEIVDAIPYQRCVLLVTVENDGSRGEAVQITVSAPGATVEVEPTSLMPGDVAEVIVIPDPLSQARVSSNGMFDGRQVTATIFGERGDASETATIPITITTEEEDLVEPLAVEVRDMFIPWLATARPELGIDDQTAWTPTIVTPHILVVTHYLFLSDEWEMHVCWHVMIPPYDWAQIDLRRRFVETTPSLAFEIPSRSADPPLEANEIDPPEECWR
jgi:hypothetical protein